MQATSIDHMFNFHFTKSSQEIKEKMTTKVVALKAKIEERKTRIRTIREEFKITNEVYIDLLEQAREASKRKENRMSYVISSKNDAQVTQSGPAEEAITIGAGTVNALLTETDFVKSEEAQVQRLALLMRNLQDEERDWSNGRAIGWTLREDELKYLGF